jgi:molecular chaperone HtpG
MPDSYTIVVNANHPMVIDILEATEKEYGDKLSKINGKIEAAAKQENQLAELLRDKKEADLSEEEKKERDDLSAKLSDLRAQRTDRLREIGTQNPVVKQLIDLALLSNGMLRGEQLTNFIRRSVELIGK